MSAVVAIAPARGVARDGASSQGSACRRRTRRGGGSRRSEGTEAARMAAVEAGLVSDSATADAAAARVAYQARAAPCASRSGPRSRSRDRERHARTRPAGQVGPLLGSSALHGCAGCARHVRCGVGRLLRQQRKLLGRRGALVRFVGRVVGQVHQSLRQLGCTRGLAPRGEKVGGCNDRIVHTDKSHRAL